MIISESHHFSMMQAPTFTFFSMLIQAATTLKVLYLIANGVESRYLVLIGSTSTTKLLSATGISINDLISFCELPQKALFAFGCGVADIIICFAESYGFQADLDSRHGTTSSH